LIRSRAATARRAQTDELRAQFCVEYDRAVAEYGDRNTAEADLRSRLAQAKSMRLTDLTSEQDAAFRKAWDEIQIRVIDSPTRAVVDAERLLEDALIARGYPRSLGERITTLSVREPILVDDYREAHGVAVQAIDARANTEACRQALLRYRRLFDAVLMPEQAPEDARQRLDLRDRSREHVEENEHNRVTG
jgi:hypothetical protein